MSNLFNFPKTLEPAGPETGLEPKWDRNQELNKLIAEVKSKQNVNAEDWSKISELIPSGRRIKLDVPIPKNLTPSAYFNQKQFNDRQDSSAAQLKAIGMSPQNNRIYVVDDYVPRHNLNGVIVSHGKMVSAVIDQVTKGQAQIIEVPFNVPNSSIFSPTRHEKAIRKVMEMECERQGKTPQTVDLRNITVNLSQAYFGDDPPQGIVNSVNALTSRGASVVISMGNSSLNTMINGIKGALFVDGSVDKINDPINKAPVPSTLYNNQGFSEGENIRTPESFKGPSSSIIAPSILKTQLAPNGDLQIKGRNLLDWNNFIDAKDTVPIPTVVQLQGPLEGLIAGKHVTFEEVKKFSAWVDQIRNDERFKGFEKEPLLYAAVANESKTRFGGNPVITHTEIMANAQPYNDALKILLENGTPEGRDLKKVVFSVDEAVMGNLRTYLEGSDGKLKTSLPGINATTGTSFAAPVASGFEAIRKQKQLNSAGAGNSNGNAR